MLEEEGSAFYTAVDRHFPPCNRKTRKGGEGSVLDVTRSWRFPLLVPLVFLTLPVIGCGHRYVSPAAYHAPTDSTKGYVYGNFSLRVSFGFWRMALQLENVDTGEKLNLRFAPEAEQGVYAVAVAPGTYRVCCALFADATPAWSPVLGASRVLALSDPTLTKPFWVETGKGYYIGDFAGEIRPGFMKTGFALPPKEDRFAATSEEFRTLYPNMAKMTLMRSWKDSVQKRTPATD